MTDQLVPATATHPDTDTRGVDDSTLEERPASSWAFVPEEPEADEVVVRRNGVLSLVVAGVSALVSAAYFARAATTGGTLDWALCVVLAVLTWAFVFSFLDSRMPLLVADSHGVRIRLGRTWRGMAWGDLDEVEHLPRRGALRDGKLTLFPREVDGELALLGPAGQRHARFTDRMLGAPFAVPLGLTTRVLGAGKDLTGALLSLAGGRCEVVEVVPETAPEAVPAGLDDYFEQDGEQDGEHDDEQDGEQDGEQDDELAGRDTDQHVAVARRDDDTEPGDLLEDTHESVLAQPTPVVTPVVASPTPSPLRDPARAVRADLPVERERPEPEPTQPVVVGAFRGGDDSSTHVIDDLHDVPVVDPVIGPQLAAARERLRLSVDQLAERTRIRPHVIEAVEIDDFVPCGGDFYARGHLRTLARVLGVDAAPLLATYDERYADAPIDPRRVFEAELATGRHGPIRGTRGGPNWSVIVAAVMTVVLCWSVARLVMENPATVSPASPSLSDGSAGLTSGSTKAAKAVPVVVTAAGGGARVVVRDGQGAVVFTGSLAFGQSRTVKASPPVRVQTSDGSTEVTVDGQEHGALGRTGEPAQDVFTVR